MTMERAFKVIMDAVNGLVEEGVDPDDISVAVGRLFTPAVLVPPEPDYIPEADCQHLDIPDEQWSTAGADEDVDARLRVTVYVNRIPFHFEAFAVDPKADPKNFQPIVEASFGEELYNAWHEYEGFPGEPMYETTIRGRNYVVFAHPFFN